MTEPSRLVPLSQEELRQKIQELFRAQHRRSEEEYVSPYPDSSQPNVAGSVLPIQKAEELLQSLQDVVSAKIVADSHGGVEAIHVLVTGETATPKQIVRNVESALMARLGMAVDHRKISVATTMMRPTKTPVSVPAVEPEAVQVRSRAEPVVVQPEAQPKVVPEAKGEEAKGEAKGEEAKAETEAKGKARRGTRSVPDVQPANARGLYFEDVEVRGSRAKGSACKVTLRRGEDLFIGEAEGYASDRSRVELSARATMAAIQLGESELNLSLEGAKVVVAFERELVLVGIVVRRGRQSVLLTGSCEIKDSSETASALAVLNATNRWVDGAKM